MVCTKKLTDFYRQNSRITTKTYFHYIFHSLVMNMLYFSGVRERTTYCRASKYHCVYIMCRTLCARQTCVKKRGDFVTHVDRIEIRSAYVCTNARHAHNALRISDVRKKKAQVHMTYIFKPQMRNKILIIISWEVPVSHLWQNILMLTLLAFFFPTIIALNRSVNYNYYIVTFFLTLNLVNNL